MDAVGRLLVLRVEEVKTEEKEDVKGEVEAVLARGRFDDSSELEPRSVDKGVRPRRAEVPGGGRPQADCCDLSCRTPELLVEPEAMEF